MRTVRTHDRATNPRHLSACVGALVAWWCSAAKQHATYFFHDARTDCSVSRGSAGVRYSYYTLHINVKLSGKLWRKPHIHRDTGKGLQDIYCTSHVPTPLYIRRTTHSTPEHTPSTHSTSLRTVVKFSKPSDVISTTSSMRTPPTGS